MVRGLRLHGCYMHWLSASAHSVHHLLKVDLLGDKEGVKGRVCIRSTRLASIRQAQRNQQEKKEQQRHENDGFEVHLGDAGNDRVSHSTVSAV